MRDPEVRPGRLLEHAVADASGIERRAFGEFIGPRGERASYAVGWTTGGGEPTGRLTVGIGVGNADGGSFHAVVFEHEGGYALALVDEPFAVVPEGGPDLSRDAALAHVDLPFIWYVADHVMDLDPRARWMGHWVTSTNAIVTREVLAREEPAQLVQHDDDGYWQVIGSTGAGPGGGVLHLWHLVDDDPSLTAVLDLEPGEAAWRSRVGDPWQRGESPP